MVSTAMTATMTRTMAIAMPVMIVIVIAVIVVTVIVVAIAIAVMTAMAGTAVVVEIVVAALLRGRIVAEEDIGERGTARCRGCNSRIAERYHANKRSKYFHISNSTSPRQQ